MHQKKETTETKPVEMRYKKFHMFAFEKGPRKKERSREPGLERRCLGDGSVIFNPACPYLPLLKELCLREKPNDLP